MIIDMQDLDRPDRPATGFLYALMKSIIQDSAGVPSPSPLLRGARLKPKSHRWVEGEIYLEQTEDCCGVAAQQTAL